METAELHPKGLLKEYTGGQDRILVPSGIPLRVALTTHGIPPELVAMAFVNQTPKQKDDLIQPGEIIDLVAIVGGG